MDGPLNSQSSSNIDHYWYRQGVIDQIFEIYRIGSETNNTKPLILPTVIEQGEVELFKASIILFGSWGNAISEAGLGSILEKQMQDLNKDYWTSERIIKQIQLLFSGGVDLSAGFIKHIYPELYYFSRKKDRFGAWTSALEEREVDLRNLRSNRNRFWSLKRIFSTIIDYDMSYGDIQPVTIRKQNPSLYSASRRYFKTWPEAVKRAGASLQKNLIKVVIEPLRNYILLEVLKKIFDALNIPYKEQNNGNGTMDDGLDRYNLIIPEVQKLPNLFLEKIENKDRIYVTTSYRTWKPGIDQRIKNWLDIYQKVEIYNSVGEPRKWIDDKVRFNNFNQFYDILAQHGRDQIISELSLLARGGIPKEYMEHYESIMKSLKKSIKNG